MGLRRVRKRKESDEPAFPSLTTESHMWDYGEYLSIDKPDSDAVQAAESERHLQALGLSAYATAAEVRDRARQVQKEFIRALEKAGIEGIPQALCWALGQVDTADLTDVFYYLFRGEYPIKFEPDR